MRPLATLGTSFDLNRMFRGNEVWDEETREMFQTKDGRSWLFDQNALFDKYGHIYKPGDVIPNMFIKMSLTWEHGSKTPWVEENHMAHFPAGIITEQKVLNMFVQQTNTKHENTLIKEESLKYVDSQFNDIVQWHSVLTLSDILTNIVKKQKQGKYWVIACREGDIVDAEQKCGEANLTKLSSSTDTVFGSFTDKMKDFKDHYIKYSVKHTLLTKHPALIETFLSDYYGFLSSIVYPTNEQRFPYLINSDLLCEVNNLYVSNNIPTALITKMQNNVHFKSYKRLYKHILAAKEEKEKQEKEKREKEKRERERQEKERQERIQQNERVSVHGSSKKQKKTPNEGGLKRGFFM